MERLVYTCALCEKVHEGLPAITFDAPALYYDIPEDERDERAHLAAGRVSFRELASARLGTAQRDFPATRHRAGQAGSPPQ